jgi:hypothetical protein
MELPNQLPVSPKEANTGSFHPVVTESRGNFRF